MLRKKKGFTLLELMTVIAIIGILAAIAIPNFFGFKKSGYRSSVKNDLRSLFMASQVYYSRNPYGIIITGDDLKDEGYIQTENVIVSVVNGAQTTLEIKAYHKLGDETYKMNYLGVVSEY